MIDGTTDGNSPIIRSILSIFIVHPYPSVPCMLSDQPTSQSGQSRRVASLAARASLAKVRISGASATQPSSGSRLTSRRVLQALIVEGESPSDRPVRPVRRGARAGWRSGAARRPRAAARPPGRGRAGRRPGLRSPGRGGWAPSPRRVRPRPGPGVRPSRRRPARRSGEGRRPPSPLQPRTHCREPRRPRRRIPPRTSPSRHQP